MNISDLKLVAGVGNYEKGTACVMSAAVAMERLRLGQPMGDATDDMECFCPVVRGWLIAANDAGWWASSADRTSVLIPFAARVAGTRGDDNLTRRRLWRVIEVSVKEFLPVLLRQLGLDGEAGKLEMLELTNDSGASAIDRDLALDIARDLDLDLDLDLALDIARALDLDRDLDLDLDLDLALDRALALARALSLDLDSRSRWLHVADELIEMRLATDAELAAAGVAAGDAARDAARAAFAKMIRQHTPNFAGGSRE